MAPNARPQLLDTSEVAFWNRKKKAINKPPKLAVKARNLINKKKAPGQEDKVVPPLDEDDLNELEDVSPLGGRGNYRWNNWAHIFSCTPKYYYEPATKQDIIEILKL